MSKYEMDMTSGSIFKKVVRFSFPIMVSSMLQLLFNSVDTVVVGHFAGDGPLAAVGSTGSLINLMTNLFFGIGVGTNVMVANYYGAKREQEASETLHTSVVLSVILGLVLAVIGWFFSGTFLEWMGSPDEVLGMATTYMKIYFLGCPFMLYYNMTSAALRAIGDTKRPLYILLASGVLNAVMNVIFVVFFHMDVDGVAIATVMSQALCSVLVTIILLKEKGMMRLELKKLKITGPILGKLLKIGIPSGVQGSVFAISNVLIQSSINSFGKFCMAGSTAASNIEGFSYMAMNSIATASINFVSQNIGAGKIERVKKIMRTTCLMAAVVGCAFSVVALLFGKNLIHIFTTTEESVDFAMKRLMYVMVPYALCGVMDCLGGGERGMGLSMTPTVISLMGSCIFRIIWIYTVFANVHTPEMLFITYPISWAITAIGHTVAFIIAYKKRLKASEEYQKRTEKVKEMKRI